MQFTPVSSTPTRFPGSPITESAEYAKSGATFTAIIDSQREKRAAESDAHGDSHSDPDDGVATSDLVEVESDDAGVDDQSEEDAFQAREAAPQELVGFHAVMPKEPAIDADGDKPLRSVLPDDVQNIALQASQKSIAPETHMNGQTLPQTAVEMRLKIAGASTQLNSKLEPTENTITSAPASSPRSGSGQAYVQTEGHSRNSDSADSFVQTSNATALPGGNLQTNANETFAPENAGNFVQFGGEVVELDLSQSTEIQTMNSSLNYVGNNDANTLKSVDQAVLKANNSDANKSQFEKRTVSEKENRANQHASPARLVLPNENEFEGTLRKSPDTANLSAKRSIQLATEKPNPSTAAVTPTSWSIEQRFEADPSEVGEKELSSAMPRDVPGKNTSNMVDSKNSERSSKIAGQRESSFSSRSVDGFGTTQVSDLIHIEDFSESSSAQDGSAGRIGDELDGSRLNRDDAFRAAATKVAAYSNKVAAFPVQPVLPFDAISVRQSSKKDDLILGDPIVDDSWLVGAQGPGGSTLPGGSSVIAEPYQIKADMGRLPFARISEILSRQANRVVEISLNPRELGRVRMSLSTLEGNISVLIQTERGETTDLMRRHIENLAQEFRRLGFENVGFEFSNQGSEKEQNQRATIEEIERISSIPGVQPAALAVSETTSSGLDLRI